MLAGALMAEQQNKQMALFNQQQHERAAFAATETRYKPETGCYRVVHSPSVVVRNKPNGQRIGQKMCGDVVRTNMRTVGGQDSGWVRLQESFNGGDGWMLVHGEKMGVGILLQPIVEGQRKTVSRYRVMVGPSTNVRNKPRGDIVGKRMFGRVIRTDLEVNGWVRLQNDFFKEGRKEMCEGWCVVDGKSMGMPLCLQRWTAGLPSLDIGKIGVSDTTRYWVVSTIGAYVRERPWGRVVGKKVHGALLRCDAMRDGWVRLEEDFLDNDAEIKATAASTGVVIDDDDEEVKLLEGWVLMDGRDLGLNRQLQSYKDEAEVPKDPPKTREQQKAFDEHVANRKQMRLQAEKENGEDHRISKLVETAGLPAELATKLETAGVTDLNDLIQVVSVGDWHEELKKRGVTKLGQRQKLHGLVQPYWQALTHKEAGNALYKDSRFDEALATYTLALKEMGCHSTDLAITCFSNRAACFQQMREPEQALADVLHVLRYDPTNEKAQARRQVYEKAMAGY
eukprot:CAMPEP_0119316352 /NCGR_PEP_ID=MMETSP1333-20130426/39425_1 /TAXON_ID=418940 /ORGANISM="Scyphosphaera apsteinii, Strain RCC1455" /LENGTH=508 /DNA_ID=CAMNT_0007321973 /DNA_START=74 /DNA_END=1600 /DNA_ORIENTATION=+